VSTRERAVSRQPARHDQALDTGENGGCQTALGILDVSVTDRKPEAPAGARYARFRGAGSVKRSEFGMVKYIDMVGDRVDFSIRTDAWR